MSLADGFCDALTRKGKRCSKPATWGHHDFTWCKQHAKFAMPEKARKR